MPKSGGSHSAPSALILLDRRLNERRVLRAETLQALVRLQRHIRHASRLGQALFDAGTHLRLVGAAVAVQLTEQTVLVEAADIVEQTHLHENTVDIVVRQFGVLEVPGLEFCYLLFGDVVLGYAQIAILDQISVGLYGPVVVGNDLRWRWRWRKS